MSSLLLAFCGSVLLYAAMMTIAQDAVMAALMATAGILLFIKPVLKVVQGLRRSPRQKGVGGRKQRKRNLTLVKSNKDNTPTYH